MNIYDRSYLFILLVSKEEKKSLWGNDRACMKYTCERKEKKKKCNKMRYFIWSMRWLNFSTKITWNKWKIKFYYGFNKRNIYVR